MLQNNLQIKQVISNIEFNANAYIVFNANEALVIDPCIPYEEALKHAKGAKIKAVLITHGHIDHFYYLHEYFTKEEIKAIYYHKAAREKLASLKKSYAILTKNPLPFTNEEKSIFVKDGDKIKVGNIGIDVIYTPGHSNCSLCFLIDDFLFTGDTLFNHSVGRSDLYSGSEKDLNNSLLNLVKLYPTVNIFPGHGKCTTMQDEIAYNPYISK